jgi:adenine specific DNA methylase mod
MSKKLELTWIDKEKVIEVEPRLLIENPELSNVQLYPDTENMIIHGDNLLALKALESKYAGKVKCIYIDPPYNTGSAFEHYDDNVEHSIWLSLMRPRLEILRNLLSDDGSIWITLDDNEAHYLKVLCDEIFGRNCFVQTVVWKSSDNSNNDSKQFSQDHNYILVYSKSPEWKPNKLPRNIEQSKHYSNPDNDPRGPWFDGNPLGSPNPRPNLIYDIIAPNGNVISAPFNGWRWSKETLEEKIATGEIRFNENYTAIKRRTYLLEQDGLPPSSLWSSLLETGHTRQAKYEQKSLYPEMTKNEWFSTPKPERLIEKILKIATNPDDIVLDSFLGSGTTAAVAHKMGRRYIGIEMGEHAYSHCKTRLDKVIDGNDQSGISVSKEEFILENEHIREIGLDINEVKIFNKVLAILGKELNELPKEVIKSLKKLTKVKKVKGDLVWQGGGGYRFYELAPTLIQKDNFDEEIINPAYDANMLASAVALHEGFIYQPDEEQFWKQAYGSENSYLFVTTRYVSKEYLSAIHSNMAGTEYLIIACRSFEDGVEKQYPNITVKKIPQMLLDRCEFGKENYNLNIINPPVYEEDDDDEK